MACEERYITAEEREQMRLDEEERKLQEDRDDALAKLEREFGMGTARIETDVRGNPFIVCSGGAYPEGMSDICVLDALNERNSMEFQLAKQQARMEDVDFASLHAGSHKHGGS